MVIEFTGLVEQLKNEATNAGALVYVASDAEDARNYVLKLAQEHIVKLAVKSDSMLAQEIGLRQHLEKSGIEVKETEIMEWWAQLGNAAYDTLRQHYINADLGISEANIGIAETGTLTIMGNEGNERLAAILPRIHLTLISSENLVPTMEDAVAKLKSISQSVLGRKMPRYVTYITGRNTTGDILGALTARAQGPEEEYIVIINKVTNL